MEVCILGFDHVYAGSFTILGDIFTKAGTLGRQFGYPDIRVAIVSVDGSPIRCRNKVLVEADCAVGDMADPDILLIASVHEPGAIPLATRAFLTQRIKKMFRKGTIVASVCTGAFVLAWTGLLNGKGATTHWSAADAFQREFPKVVLRSDQMIVNHGSLYCAGGGGAGTDLVYSLLERMTDHRFASLTAKFFVHDFKRVPQQAYSVYSPGNHHRDKAISRVREWISQHLEDPLRVPELAGIARMSLRTFERRFKQATGSSPSIYVQRLRVEAAKQQLETTDKSFDEIAYSLGYQNTGSFRKVFFKWVRLLPSEYRRRFSAHDVASQMPGDSRS